MSVTLMIEMYAASLRLIAFDYVEESYSEIDITGGYGKKSIPLFSHYVHEEPLPLIGEDALLYDEEEMLFVECMYDKEQWFKDYMKVLLGKVLNHHFRDTITQIIFIYPQQVTVQHLISIQEFSDISVCWMSFETCSAGYLKYCLTQSNEPIQSSLVFDEVYVYIGNYMEASHTFKLLQFSLIECDIYYRDRLKSFHAQDMSDFKILKLYESQKSIIQQQILTKKDVNVYSSLSYPPQKITLKYQEIFEFLRQWDSEYGVSFLQKTKSYVNSLTVIANSLCDHPIIKSFFGKKLMSFQREDFLLSKGCIFSLKAPHTTLIKQPIIFTDTYIITTVNREIEVIRRGEPFLKLVKIELVVTGKNNYIELVKLDETASETASEKNIINRLSIDINQSVCILDYCIQFDEEKKVSEVYYELR